MHWRPPTGPPRWPGNRMFPLAERLVSASEALSHMSETPRLDADLLMAHALGISRAQLLARLHEPCAAPAFEDLLARRLAFEPLAYILGEWEFFSLQFYSEPPMLVPRPETEHLVEAVLDFTDNRPARVLDIGTGTGCVALSIAHNAPACSVTATDINPAAIALAKRNAARHHLSERVTLHLGDLFAALPADEPPFDAVCSNPPYVEEGDWDDLDPVIRLHEDPRALLAGDDGLDIVRTLIQQAPAYLKPGGLLAFEIGMGQYSEVARLLTVSGYETVTSKCDLAGIQRIAMARKAP